MPNHSAPALALRDGDRDVLGEWLRSRSVRAGLMRRARMILLAADGVGNREIARRVGASPTTVIAWRARYERGGLAGLADQERSGRPRVAGRAAPPRRTVRRRPAHTAAPKPVRRSSRGAILKAAGELILVGGFESTTMQAVASRAGVSKTTVYAHFPGKLALFTAVMAEAAAGLAAGLQQALRRARGDRPEERLAAVLAEMLCASTRPELLAFFRVLITETERRALLTAGMDEVVTAAPDPVGTLAPLLVECAAEAGFDLGAPRRFTAMLFHQVSAGIQLDMLISGYRPKRPVLETYARYAVGLFLRGIRPEHGTRAELPAGYDYPWGPALFRGPDQASMPSGAGGTTG